MSHHDVDARIREAVSSRGAVPLPDFDDVQIRAARHSRRQRASGWAAGLAFLMVMLIALASLGLARRSDIASEGAETASVLGLTCGADGMSVTGEAVMATSNGVHFRVDVSGSRTAMIQGHGGIEGDLTLAFPPGDDYILMCSDLDGGSVETARFAVVDPQHAWIAPFGGCGQDWSAFSGGTGESEPNLARLGDAAFGRVRAAGDEYRFSGYPQSPVERHIDLLRDGKAIASVVVRFEGDSWSIGGGTGMC